MILLEELEALYPGLSPEELAIAKENLDRYIALALDIVEGYLERAKSGVDFSASRSHGTIEGKVDCPIN